MCSPPPFLPQHVPEVVGVGGAEAARPVDPPRPDGAQAPRQGDAA